MGKYGDTRSRHRRAGFFNDRARRGGDGEAGHSPEAGGGIAAWLKSPGLAIEFARFSEVGAILSDRGADGDSPMRKELRQGLYMDYCFIAMYWLLFAGLSALLARRNYA